MAKETLVKLTNGDKVHKCPEWAVENFVAKGWTVDDPNYTTKGVNTSAKFEEMKAQLDAEREQLDAEKAEFEEMKAEFMKAQGADIVKPKTANK